MHSSAPLSKCGTGNVQLTGRFLRVPTIGPKQRKRLRDLFVTVRSPVIHHPMVLLMTSTYPVLLQVGRASHEVQSHTRRQRLERTEQEAR